MKPNCYECKYRKNLIGDAHSSCAHPSNEKIAKDLMINMLAKLATIVRTDSNKEQSDIHVVGNPYGIRMGWFNYPWNFDPTWLESCDGFIQKTIA